jgi:hypothetical protein
MTEDPKVNIRQPDTYGGVQPTNVGSVLHDAVVGTEITLWLAATTGPIGVRMDWATAEDLRKRLDDLIAHVE